MLRPLPSKGMVQAECRMSSTISPCRVQRCFPQAAHAERPSTHDANRAKSLVCRWSAMSSALPSLLWVAMPIARLGRAITLQPGTFAGTGHTGLPVEGLTMVRRGAPVLAVGVPRGAGRESTCLRRSVWPLNAGDDCKAAQ